MKHKLPIILAVAMAALALSLYLSDRGFEPARLATQPVEVKQNELAVVPVSLRQSTYTPPQNIYLPEMMFLVVKDTNSLGITRCKNMAYRIVDSFSRQVNSNLVRADKKLNTLARITYNECINVTIDTHKKGL